MVRQLAQQLESAVTAPPLVGCVVWMPKSSIKCVERKHSVYKLSIMHPTEYNNYKQLFKKYSNKLTNLKRDLERNYYCDQLDNNKTDIKNHRIS